MHCDCHDVQKTINPVKEYTALQIDHILPYFWMVDRKDDDIGFCAKASQQATNSCPQLAGEVLGLNQTEVQYLISLQNTNTCSTSRRLLQSSSGTIGYSKAQLDAELDRKLFSNFAKLKESIVRFIGNAGSCSKAKKKARSMRW